MWGSWHSVSWHLHCAIFIAPHRLRHHRRDDGNECTLCMAPPRSRNLLADGMQRSAGNTSNRNLHGAIHKAPLDVGLAAFNVGISIALHTLCHADRTIMVGMAVCAHCTWRHQDVAISWLVTKVTSHLGDGYRWGDGGGHPPTHPPLFKNGEWVDGWPPPNRF